jgi:hypothetical protein
MARAKQSGRILPHQRQTDDVTPIIAGDEITGDQAAAVHDTHSKGMKSKTRNEYRNRQSHIYKLKDGMVGGCGFAGRHLLQGAQYGN